MIVSDPTYLGLLTAYCHKPEMLTWMALLDRLEEYANRNAAVILRKERRRPIVKCVKAAQIACDYGVITHVDGGRIVPWRDTNSTCLYLNQQAGGAARFRPAWHGLYPSIECHAPHGAGALPPQLYAHMTIQFKADETAWAGQFKDDITTRAKLCLWLGAPVPM